MEYSEQDELTNSNGLEFARRVLLVVTGLSPQVVTETLYALGMEYRLAGAGKLPTEIHVITTKSGARLVQSALLDPVSGQFPALLADYPELGRPVFTEEHIHLIRDDCGEPLNDIRTPEENASAADTITALISELTRDSRATLHASIAGGRKTMGFYVGYAFSLFARPQDVLSHVLVSAPFENHPAFYFPPRTPRLLTTRSGEHICTSEAHVTLARIPVVRLRHGQPKALLLGQASFNDTVSAIQKGLEPPKLEISLRAQHVSCGGQKVKLPAALVAWLAWWATHVLQGTPEQSWRTAGAHEYLRIYAQVVGRHSAAYENAEKRLRDGMEKSFFEENNAKLQRRLKEQLGLAATPYLLGTAGKRPETRKYLSMRPDSINVSE